MRYLYIDRCSCPDGNREYVATLLVHVLGMLNKLSL